MIKLAKEIIDGRRLSREDDLSIFIDCDLEELCEGADLIRKHFAGDLVDMCAVVNGKCGKCPEDCTYCIQSVHNDGVCDTFDFISEEEIISACKVNEAAGVDRFSIVTSGRALKGAEFDAAVKAYERMKRECNIGLCASMGFIDADQLHRLHEAGVTMYHHNIETSKNYFSNICTTHTYEQKLHTISLVKAEGMKVCSGGIIGLGESIMERLDMAMSLYELGAASIPINTLIPKKGTPLENQPRLSEEEVLRTFAFFRYINPEASIRLAAGRSLMDDDGLKTFSCGASSTITGNLLTSAAKASIKSDKEALKSIGRIVK